MLISTLEVKVVRDELDGWESHLQQVKHKIVCLSCSKLGEGSHIHNMKDYISKAHRALLTMTFNWSYYSRGACYFVIDLSCCECA